MHPLIDDLRVKADNTLSDTDVGYLVARNEGVERGALDVQTNRQF